MKRIKLILISPLLLALVLTYHLFAAATEWMETLREEWNGWR